MNHVRILFFATLRDRVGTRSVELQIAPKTSVAELKALLFGKFPTLNDLASHMLIAVNQEYVFEDAIIPDQAEIALFPPVSGG